MVLETWPFQDPTGGGAMIAVVGSQASLVVSKDVEIVGYCAGGTSADHVQMTVAGDANWEAGGYYFSNTLIGTIVAAHPVRWLKHRIPLKKGSTMTLTSVSGANPHFLLFYVDDGIAPVFQPPKGPSSGKAMKMSLISAASGTNTTALTAQINLAVTELTAFTDPRKYTPTAVRIFATMTGPTVFVGLSKGASQYVTWWPIPLLPRASNFQYELPEGMPEFVSGDRCKVHWLSEAAEQPRAIVDFAYAP